jgi:hypothetical protein
LLVSLDGLALKSTITDRFPSKCARFLSRPNNFPRLRRFLRPRKDLNIKCDDTERVEVTRGVAANVQARNVTVAGLGAAADLFAGYVVDSSICKNIHNNFFTLSFFNSFSLELLKGQH